MVDCRKGMFCSRGWDPVSCNRSFNWFLFAYFGIEATIQRSLSMDDSLNKKAIKARWIRCFGTNVNVNASHATQGTHSFHQDYWESQNVGTAAVNWKANPWPRRVPPLLTNTTFAMKAHHLMETGVLMKNVALNVVILKPFLCIQLSSVFYTMPHPSSERRTAGLPIRRI